jgi:diphthamide synthase (EF-2-diphthine--ammonia ligase)
MGAAIADAKLAGITHVIFGDLFLADVRAYREQKLAGTGIAPVFPLWGRPTAALARAMIASGLQAHLVSLDRTKLDLSFAGRRFDQTLLADFPPGIDPCGENGEFHTCVVAAPVFSRPIEVASGEVVERDGFAYCDLVLA